MKKFYIALLVSFTFLAATAQDIHYTQFYNSPLTLNPALTGLFNGQYRVSAIYRNQWFSAVNNGFFNSPYQTPSIAFDMPITIKNKDVIGVGAFILYDDAGAGSIATFTGQVSASYIKHLGPNGRHQLSAGFQLGFTQTKLNGSDAKFASQFSNNEFNPNNMSSSPTLLPNVMYVNLNVGLLYYGKLTDKIAMDIGGTIFNTTVPKVNLVTDQNKQTLSLRGNITGGLDFTLGRRYHILPSVLWMRQSNDNQLNSGVGFGYDINMRTNLTLGIYNRVNDLLDAYHHADAAIVYAAFQIKGFKLGASYDFTVSKLSSGNPGTGGLEISLTYIGFPKVFDERQMLFCPRF